MTSDLKDDAPPPALRSAKPLSIAIAQCTASTTLANSIRMPSPAVFDDADVTRLVRPVDQLPPQFPQVGSVSSSKLTSRAIAGNISGENRDEAMGHGHSVSPAARRRPER